jgi:hypothetical protein
MLQKHWTHKLTLEVQALNRHGRVLLQPRIDLPHRGLSLEFRRTLLPRLRTRSLELPAVMEHDPRHQPFALGDGAEFLSSNRREKVNAARHFPGQIR